MRVTLKLNDDHPQRFRVSYSDQDQVIKEMVELFEKGDQALCKASNSVWMDIPRYLDDYILVFGPFLKHATRPDVILVTVYGIRLAGDEQLSLKDVRNELCHSFGKKEVSTDLRLYRRPEVSPSLPHASDGLSKASTVDSQGTFVPHLSVCVCVFVRGCVCECACV